MNNTNFRLSVLGCDFFFLVLSVGVDLDGRIYQNYPQKGGILAKWSKMTLLCGGDRAILQNFLNCRKKSGILKGKIIVGSIPSGKGDQLLP